MEMICALTILVIGVFGVFVLLISSIQTNAECGHFSIARAAAEQQIESARMFGFNSESLVTKSTILPTGGAETFNVAVFNGQVDVHQVTVTISWPEPGRGSDSITLSTLLVRGGLNGVGNTGNGN